MLPVFFFFNLKESIVRAYRGLLFIKKPIVLCVLGESQLISIISRKKTKGDNYAFFFPFLEYCSS